MPKTKRKSRISEPKGPRAAQRNFSQMTADSRPAIQGVGGRAAFGLQHMLRQSRAKRGLGWLRDLPDFRDTTLFPKQKRLERPEFSAEKKLHGRVADTIGKRLQSTSDLPDVCDSNEQYCTPVEDQLNLGSCTANAGAGMVEYMESRAQGTYVDASRLFLYKVTRNLLGLTGDTGAYLRTTMKSLVLFGAPPEQWWPYDDLTTFDDEPDAFLYAFAANYRAIQYMRLDPPGISGPDVLDNVKASLVTGYVSMFGFPVYSSLGTDPEIPYPTPWDSLSGGHAILAVGYDDNKSCPNATTGALRIRNSWGQHWGDGGYGWLPYDYVLNGLATDFWTCFKLEWVDTGEFG